VTDASQPPVIDPGPATADPPGFFTREAERFLPGVRHAEAEAGRIAGDVSTALQDHAGTVFDVAGDVFGVLKLIDPADAPLIAAAEALVPKVLAMVEKATALAQGALKG
jgi:hypothetical protein